MLKPRPPSGPGFMLARSINTASEVVSREQPKLAPKASQWRTQGSKNLNLNLKNRRYQLLSVLITLRPPKKLGKRRRRKRTTKNIDNSAYQTMSPSRPPQPLEVTQPTPLPENLGFRKTSARLSVITITNKDIMQLSVLSHLSQKISINFDNLSVSDWCQ